LGWAALDAGLSTLLFAFKAAGGGATTRLLAELLVLHSAWYSRQLEHVGLARSHLIFFRKQRSQAGAC